MNELEKWVKKGADKDVVNKLISDFPFMSVHQIVFLIRRGLDTKVKIDKFLNYSSQDVTSVREMKDYSKFFNRLHTAITNKEQITIYGDYDVDGITGTSILVRFIRLLGCEPHFFINSRFEEGFGINAQGVKNLLARFPDTQLIITVDNGISGHDGVDEANSNGVDVLVTDHHEPKSATALPNAIAVIDAKREDETVKFKDLCGATLAYKLGLSVLEEIAPDKVAEFTKSLSLVALGTICDVVPLYDENHYFAKQGLQLVNDDCFPVWSILKNITGTKGQVTETTFGYFYGPMLNALGRLDGRPLDAVELMITDDLEALNTIALDLKLFNETRKALTSEQMKDAEYFILSHQEEQKESMVVYGNFHEGIAGILAGRLKEKYYKPVIVLCKTEDSNIYKGSARSVPGFNMKEALERCDHLLVKAGGHAMAAGLTIKRENLIEFAQAFNKVACDSSFFTKVDPVLEIDYLIDGRQLNFAELKRYDEFAPFGQLFGAPVVGLIGDVIEKPVLLKEKNIKIVVQGPEEKMPINVLGWNVDPMLINDFLSVKKIKAIGTLSPNLFQGSLQYNFILQGERIRPF